MTPSRPAKSCGVTGRIGKLPSNFGLPVAKLYGFSPSRLQLILIRLGRGHCALTLLGMEPLQVG
jgi:hypothetical protein